MDVQVDAWMVTYTVDGWMDAAFLHFTTYTLGEFAVLISCWSDIQPIKLHVFMLEKLYHGGKLGWRIAVSAYN